MTIMVIRGGKLCKGRAGDGKYHATSCHAQHNGVAIKANNEKFVRLAKKHAHWTGN